MNTVSGLLRQIARVMLIISITLGLTIVAIMCWLKLNSFQILSVQSNSMQPLFHKGDALINDGRSTTKYQAGDIISYHNPTEPAVIVSHRLVSFDTKTNTLITAGDYTGSVDKPISRQSVKGRVVYILPNVGYLMSALRYPISLVLIIYIPAATLLYIEFSRLQKKLKSPAYTLSNS